MSRGRSGKSGFQARSERGRWLVRPKEMPRDTVSVQEPGAQGVSTGRCTGQRGRFTSHVTRETGRGVSDWPLRWWRNQALPAVWLPSSCAGESTAGRLGPSDAGSVPTGSTESRPSPRPP